MKHIVTYTQKELNSELLEYSENKASTQKVRELILDGADVNCFDASKSRTPLIKAVLKLNYSIIKLLIENNADVNLTNRFNETCLFFITHNGNYTYKILKKNIDNIIDLLMKSGIDMKIENLKGEDIFSKIDTSNPIILQHIIETYPERYKEYLMKKTANKFNI